MVPRDSVRISRWATLRAEKAWGWSEVTSSDPTTVSPARKGTAATERRPREWGRCDKSQPSASMSWQTMVRAWLSVGHSRLRCTGNGWPRGRTMTPADA